MNVKGLIFDFGGTLDTGGNHWGEVLWEVYRHFGVPVAKDAFRKAYIHGERTLAMHPLIQPHFHFADVLRAKLRIQLGYLQEQGMLSASFAPREELAEAMAAYADGCPREVLARSAGVLGRLRPKYSMVLVSNFYGNLHTVLQDAALLPLFDCVIESAVVGVRKPNPAIFALGVCACNRGDRRLFRQGHEACPCPGLPHHLAEREPMGRAARRRQQSGGCGSDGTGGDRTVFGVYLREITPSNFPKTKDSSSSLGY